MSGLQSWVDYSSPGIELLGLSQGTSGVTQSNWRVTYVPEVGQLKTGVRTGTAINGTAAAAQLDAALANNQACTATGASSQLPFALCEYFLFVAAFVTPCINVAPGTYGSTSLAVRGTTGVSVCTRNCGVLPWSPTITYAAATGNSTAVFVPYQLFTLTFTGINATAFKINDHIGFDRDGFQQR